MWIMKCYNCGKDIGVLTTVIDKAERLKRKEGDTSWMMRCREIEFDRGYQFYSGELLNGFRFYCEECGKEKEHETNNVAIHK